MLLIFLVCTSSQSLLDFVLYRQVLSVVVDPVKLSETVGADEEVYCCERVIDWGDDE